MPTVPWEQKETTFQSPEENGRVGTSQEIIFDAPLLEDLSLFWRLFP
jgi:hypothetical protein